MPTPRWWKVRPALVAALALLAWAAPALGALPPQRVASLNLTADEILVDILPAPRLVAVTRFADEAGTSNVVGRVPAGAARLQKADLERLISLRPDLVVVSEYTDADFLRLLERSGLRVHRMSGLNSLPGFRRAVTDLGAAVGEPAAAARLVARYDATLRALEQKLAGAPRPRVLYWGDPHTAGRDTAIGAIIECAGARNVGAELGLEGIVPLGAERTFVADPDVVLVGTGFGTAAALREHPLLAQMRAVKQGHVVELPTELLVALSHHAARACWRLAHALHPTRIGTPDP
jgi:iron complex transport system substrate-binding protein